MSSYSFDALAAQVRSELDVVAVSDLRMRYGSNDVLHGVSFTIRRGEVLVLLGPNGAGKTTTIEILEGFRLPSAGEVRVLGANPATADEAWRSRIGVVLQSWRDHGRWRVWELLDHLGEFYRPFSGPDRPRPVPDRRTDRDGRPRRAPEQEGLHAVRRAAPAARCRDRHRRSPRAAVPRRADGGFRSGRPPGLPRPGASACRPTGHHHPADHPRPGRGGETRRSDPDPQPRPHRRQRQRRRTGPSGRRQRRGAVDPGRFSAGARHPGSDRLRQGPLRRREQRLAEFTTSKCSDPAWKART